MLPLEALYAATDSQESETVRAVLGELGGFDAGEALSQARALVRGVRSRADERPYLDAFLQEFGLSNQEGIALMCLAEALLRIPDDATADRLIAQTLGGGDWSAHAGQSESLFVNASVWGLMMTGRIVELPEEARQNAGGWFQRLARRLGEPIVRQAVRRAVRIIGDEFVVGTDIEHALARSERERPLALCSYDMLGEGARTDADAQRHLAAYERAIVAIGAIAGQVRQNGPSRPAHDPTCPDPMRRSSISIKLSALDPRYCLAQHARVQARLLPKALELARLAAREGLALTIDAEEADRLELSLAVIESLAADPATAGWQGLGLAVQAYNRRAPALIDWLASLARAHARVLHVRLVKGAYWDSEIKRAQERGLAHYPVYTRKASTDAAYLACARMLFAARPHLYPQFATHNALTLASVLALRPASAGLEFQRLHGMGQLLYDEAQRTVPEFPPVRVYAPVGPHADLLAYLVRRLLENGANTSFVNRFMDERVPVDTVIADPLARLAALAARDAIAHRGIPLPPALYGERRANSLGVDFGESRALAALEAGVRALRRGGPYEGSGRRSATPIAPVHNPADRRDLVGAIRFADPLEVASAFAHAAAAQPDWSATPAAERAACLERVADGLERQREQLVAMLVREAGKTLADAVAELREAVDGCRYYAAEARRLFAQPEVLPGPTGESNQLLLEGRGVIACISPWNFPLAIFLGQVGAALAAGNAVIAKPSEYTPLIGDAVVALCHQSGIPPAVLQYLPMAGPPFGETALRAAELAGIVFTGSTATAQGLHRALAQRDGAILPLIAETGGINAMIVDSTALPEQVVDDAITSAFGSAGQRCSALRLLCLQHDIADRVIEMLAGAMDTLVIGDPALAATDVGPVISERAAQALRQYLQQRCGPGGPGRVLKACPLDERHAHGSFVAPHLIALPGPEALTSEQFGPLLHVVRYRANEQAALLRSIGRSGYALTLGVQTRLESTWRNAFKSTAHGNVYVNRNMVGAVIGVQPFGGSGLSGTGPKAGGPHYLARLARERTLTINTTATGGNTALLQLDEP
jgi:RHH-type proline utilization regulon transcriptional repressor/proline dehydrogenase/delta 1-pyrroline-5-carboxylate dehydrogenase